VFRMVKPGGNNYLLTDGGEESSVEVKIGLPES